MEDENGKTNKNKSKNKITSKLGKDDDKKKTTYTTNLRPRRIIAPTIVIHMLYSNVLEICINIDIIAHRKLGNTGYRNEF